MYKNCDFPTDLLNRIKDLDSHAPDASWNEQIKTQKINSIGFLENARILIPQIIRSIDPNYRK